LVPFTGEQKKQFVDILHHFFRTKHEDLRVFLDEVSLEASGDAMGNIYAALQGSCVGTCLKATSIPGAVLVQEWPAHL
jgi:hypothetical protein